MAKRVSSTSVNWSFVFETLTSVDKPKIYPLKTSTEKYLKEISVKPADLPKIDWNFYKKRISAPGMVETFQKNYETLKVPYPSDKGMLAKIEAANTNMIKIADDKYAKLLCQKEELSKKLKELESLIRLSESTLEELYLARPEIRIDPDKPALWPQNHTLKSEKNSQ